jgi:hypothetical protein
VTANLIRGVTGNKLASSLLDYSIKDPLAPSISPRFYGWIGRVGAVQHGTRAEVLDSIPLIMHFLPLCVIISTYLVVLLSTHMVRACGRDSHAGGGMLDYSIRDPLAPFISSEFYGWTDSVV